MSNMGGTLSLDMKSLQNSTTSPGSNSSQLSPTCRITSKRSSFSKMVTAPNSRRSSVSPLDETANLNALEIEAIAAVHEIRTFVKDIYVSDKLPRTADLIYLNLTTSEGHPYCVELTSLKGWRVSSLRHDCMNGDIAHLNLHVQYFETIQALMQLVSPEFAKKAKEITITGAGAITPIHGGHTSTESETDGLPTQIGQENQTFT